jgi:hypothetical protein
MAGPGSSRGCSAASRRSIISRRFERLHESISGTMSSFYRAQGQIDRQQVVGLKVIDPSEARSDREAATRGSASRRRERLARRSVGPNIVKTLEWGIDDRRTAVRRAGICRGDDAAAFAHLAAKKPLPPAQRIDLVRQAAEGDLRRPQGRLCAPRHLPAELHPAARRQARAHRLRPHRARQAGLPPARQQDRHPELHGAGSGAPSGRPTSGSTSFRSA